MNIPPTYIVEFKNMLQGMLPVPYYPGWVVYKFDPAFYRYEHCGFIFGNKEDAESWAEDGIRPDDYWMIDWDTFPDVGCFMHHEATK